MNTDLIIKYISNNLSFSEKEAFEKEMLINEALKKEVDAFQNTWNLTDLYHQSFDEIDVNWRKFEKKKDKIVKFIHKKEALVWPKVAASILFIAATAFSIWFFTLKNHKDIINTVGIHQLNDNSTIELNANSTLFTDKKFGISNRNLSLTGEAFFDVSKDHPFPFKIAINNAEIVVLGTKFNVYNSNNYSSIELYEGSIALINNEKTIHIKPNERWEFINNKWIQSENLATQPSWTDSEYWNFQNASLEYITSQLEQYYNIDKIIYDSEKREERYTIVLPKQNIEEALHLLSKISNIPFGN